MAHNLERMTWPEAQAALRASSCVLVPTGSIEQHGIHLPLGTDFYIARHLANRVGERCNRVVVAPALPIGYAEYHGDFAGTLSLAPDVLSRMYYTICRGFVRHGVRCVVFINGHGGNAPAVRSAMQSLRNDGVVTASLAWFAICDALIPEVSVIGHADYLETSLMLAIDPTTVKLDSAASPENNRLNSSVSVSGIGTGRYAGVDVPMGLRTSDGTGNGAIVEREPPNGTLLPTPRDASPELGERILEAVTDYTVRFITALDGVTLNPVGES